MDLTTVNHRTNDAGINLTYQRFVQYDKLNKVKTYLKEYDKQFPNNIILASRTITEAKNFKAIDVSQKFLKANLSIPVIFIISIFLWGAFLQTFNFIIF